MNIVETQRARIQTLEKRIQDLESTSTVPALEKEIEWLEGIIYNSSYNDTDMRLMLQTTPREMRMGLTSTAPERTVYLPTMAKKAHCNEKTASKRLRKLADTGMFSYRTAVDPETGHTRAHLAPLAPLETAPIIHIERPKEGGSTWQDGKRVKRCKDPDCNSTNLVKKTTSQIFCADCGTPQDDPITVIKQVNSPDDLLEEEAHSHSDADTPETDHSHSDAEASTGEVLKLPSLPPITPPTYAIGEYPLNGLSLEEWLSRRIGHGQIIYSTGILDQSKKYLHKPAGYKPDIAAYLRGDLAHIYGSRPALPDGATWLLGFDSENPELDAQRLIWQQQLATAGIPSVCWLRRPGRWHLEVYADKAVDRKAFYAHLLSVCPGLAAIPECFPIGNDQNTEGVDRADFGYSWPLWYRVGNQVVECAAEVMFAGDTSPMVSTGIQSDKNRLTWLISQSIMDAALIPELPPCEEVTQEAPARGGVLLDTRLPGRQGNSCDDGVGRAVIADFNAAYTWEEIAEVKDGRIRASWRNECTPSVVINADGTAHDFGKTGRYPSHLDKFEAYCLINGIEKREELKRRIAAYQEREQLAS